MSKRSFSFSEFNFSSQAIRDLVDSSDKVSEFVEGFYSSSSIEERMNTRNFDMESRIVLKRQLAKQCESINLSEASQQNLDKIIDEETYTITTGHQLNLLTGPLYSIYKIAQVISITQELNQKFPNKNFLPIFWMATEDHDFEEINHFHLFGNKIEWNKEGQENCIAGRIKLEGIDEVLDAIKDKYQDENLKNNLEKILMHYREAENMAEATRSLINDLFGEYGLLIIDGDDEDLKELFKETMIREVSEGLAIKEVLVSNKALEEKGYHAQVYVRDCNLFYIHENGKRERIVKVGELFIINDQKYSALYLSEQINLNPQFFSPNALLRPVYQETILPNLAYIGGGGEIAYWLQLKGVFNQLDVQYPLLRVRDSLILLNDKMILDIEEMNLDLLELKNNLDALIKEITLDNADEDLQLTDAQNEIFKAKALIMDKVYKINKGLEGMVEAEFVKMIKSIERIEDKLIKSEKGKHEGKIKKLNRLKDKIFPKNGFQERFENFIPYILNDDALISRIIDEIGTEDSPRIKIISTN